MKRVVKSTNLGGGQTRYTTRLEGDDCALGTQEYKFLQWELLRQIVDQPDLVQCGFLPYEKLKVFHTGQHWVAEAEAVGQTVEVPIVSKNRSAQAAARRAAEESGASGLEEGESPTQEEASQGV